MCNLKNNVCNDTHNMNLFNLIKYLWDNDRDIAILKLDFEYITCDSGPVFVAVVATDRNINDSDLIDLPSDLGYTLNLALVFGGRQCECKLKTTEDFIRGLSPEVLLFATMLNLYYIKQHDFDISGCNHQLDISLIANDDNSSYWGDLYDIFCKFFASIDCVAAKNTLFGELQYGNYCNANKDFFKVFTLSQKK